MIGAANKHDYEPRWDDTHCDGKRVYVLFRNIVYEYGKQACRGFLSEPFGVKAFPQG
jgi:hypothetical protein